MSEFTEKLRYCSEYHGDHTAEITDDAANLIEHLESELSKMYIAFSHYHENNGVDDFCKKCGLCLTHPVHRRA